MSIQEQAMQLPRAEKLKLMEALWAELSQSDSDFESPQWHQSALQETQARYSAGGEKPVDWEEAKRQLRG